jgi:hypothetical protein
VAWQFTTRDYDAARVGPRSTRDQWVSSGDKPSAPRGPHAELENQNPHRGHGLGANAEGVFVDATGDSSGYTVSDTGGCSATQIIEEMGLGGGHARFGITKSVLEDWTTQS